LDQKFGGCGIHFTIYESLFGPNTSLFSNISLFRNLGLGLESLIRETERLVGHEHNFSAIVPALRRSAAAVSAFLPCRISFLSLGITNYSWENKSKFELAVLHLKIRIYDTIVRFWFFFMQKENVTCPFEFLSF
jgi:hypothetical protein